MSRATLLYIIMLAVCAAGLWVILGFGANLTPPVDLSGQWDLTATDPRTAERLGETLDVAQSGRFLRLSFERGGKYDLKITREMRGGAAPPPAHAQIFELEAAGKACTLAASGAALNGSVTVAFAGPERYRFVLTRPRADHSQAKDAAANAVPPPPTAQATAR
jgi:hypothetical protein